MNNNIIIDFLRCVPFISLMILSSCSWEKHLAKYYDKLPDKQGLTRREMIIKGDSIIYKGNLCLKKAYFLPDKDTTLFMSNYNCKNEVVYDTVYWNNGAIYSTRKFIKPGADLREYPYSLDTYTYFDKKGRPLRIVKMGFSADTSIQYQQFYNRERVLQTEKIRLNIKIH